MKSILPIILLFLANLAYSQTANVDLVSQVRFSERSNDIWGYEKDGVEYAIIGTQRATRILSLADPANPREVATISGASSIWRDIKHYDDYIYVVADEGSDGLLIVDMSAAPDSITHTFWKPSLGPTNPSLLRTCHNLYVDEQGYGYLSGCNIGAGGVILLDLRDNPMEPEVLGFANLTYAHDVYVQGDRMYTSEIFRGQAGIYDISDRTNPQLLATQGTSFFFTHNIWVSDDGNYMFTTDERGNAFVDAYDISDLDNISRVDRFKPIATQNTGVIPHNTHYHEGYLYTSYYTDGVVITDVNKPDNMIQVGQYDTFNGGNGGFNGNWGAYPFLSSGLLLASDINSGLYVLQPNIQRAAYLEGNVVDKATKEPVEDVKIEILSNDPNQGVTDAGGEYKSGQATAGEFQVVFSHPEYQPDTLTATLVNGEVVILNHEMRKKRKIRFEIQLVGDNDSEPNAIVVVQNDDFTYNLVSDENGIFTDSIVEGNYNVYAGEWGYNHYSLEDQTLDEDYIAIIQLEKGYQDDFIFDLGWQVSGIAPRGIWERGIPVPTFLSDSRPSNVDADILTDLGALCYITGNAGGGIGQDDVDNGHTTLTSPSFDLSTYEEPILSYSVWFLNAGGDSPMDDSLTVSISNGIDTVMIESLLDPTSAGSFWNDREITISDIIEPTADMHMIISTSDGTNGHIVEGGFDGFRIQEDGISNNNNIALSQVGNVYPNPFDRELTVTLNEEYSNDQWNVQLYNISGQLVQQNLNLAATGGVLSVETDLQTGTYILTLTNITKNISSSTQVVKF